MTTTEGQILVSPLKLLVGHLSFAGHIVRQTTSPSPDILNSRRTFHCKICGEYHLVFAGHFEVLDLHSPDKMSGEVKTLHWAFFKIRGHVRRVRRILRTLGT